MRLRKYTGMIVAAIVLTALLILFSGPRNGLRRENKYIALHNPSQVDKIMLADGYDTTILIRKEAGWSLFGGESANQVTVDNLLIAAEKLQINSIISISGNTGKGPVRKITFYKAGRPVHQFDFQVDGNRYMVTPKGSSHRYFVAVAGYPGLDMDRVFSSSANHYREHLLIDLLPSEIARIDISLQNGDQFCFVQDENGNLSCYVDGDPAPVPPGKLNELAIRLLFSYFTFIRYERKSGITEVSPEGVPTHSQLEGGKAGHRMALLHVESFKGEKHALEVFPYYTGPGKEADMFRALVRHNNGKELLVVNYIYLDVLMRKLTHYFGEKSARQ